jgi:hypothetical protein
VPARGKGGNTKTKMPAAKPMSAAMKEKWIDLFPLIECAIIRNGKLVFLYEYEDGENRNQALRTTMRIVLRGIGHKITLIDHHYYPNGNLHMRDIYTTITEEEFEKGSRLYNDWCDEVDDHNYASDSENENENEAETEENPTN